LPENTWLGSDAPSIFTIPPGHWSNLDVLGSRFMSTARPPRSKGDMGTQDQGAPRAVERHKCIIIAPPFLSARNVEQIDACRLQSRHFRPAKPLRTHAGEKGDIPWNEHHQATAG
jgi:hypothetical protein